jgi:tetratricopeptide (TPR) repeat protein
MRSRAACLLLNLVLAAFPIGADTGQSSGPRAQESASIEGTVRIPDGEPVAGATVRLESKSLVVRIELRTDTRGRYLISSCPAGSYEIRASKPGSSGVAHASLTLAANEKKQMDLILQSTRAGKTEPVGSKDSAAHTPAAIEFDDKANFTVAGVTNWSDAGLHGSDVRERTAETLARETLTLQPSAPLQATSSAPGTVASLPAESSQSEENLRAALIRDPASFQANRQLGAFCLHAKRYDEAIPLLLAAYQSRPADQANAYDLASAYKERGELIRAREQIQKLLANGENADARRLLGNVDEELGDPIDAVRQYERAVQLDPSEQNYFEWAAELLLHRADQPAVEVFGKGYASHPKSGRLLMGLGVSLYASGSYEEAARRLCEASELDPTDPDPYLFLGKIEKATVAALPCSEGMFERFAKLQPENALADYYYAVVLWKHTRGAASSESSRQAEALLKRAVALDPKLGDAYLQLGLLYFERGSLDLAIQSYRKAIEITPASAEAHHRLALAYKRTGDTSKAQHEFQAYEQAERSDSAALEKQRQELRQFVIILEAHPENASPH